MGPGEVLVEKFSVRLNRENGTVDYANNAGTVDARLNTKELKIALFKDLGIYFSSGGEEKFRQNRTRYWNGILDDEGKARAYVNAELEFARKLEKNPLELLEFMKLTNVIGSAGTQTIMRGEQVAMLQLTYNILLSTGWLGEYAKALDREKKATAIKGLEDAQAREKYLAVDGIYGAATGDAIKVLKYVSSTYYEPGTKLKRIGTLKTFTLDDWAGVIQALGGNKPKLSDDKLAVLAVVPERVRKPAGDAPVVATKPAAPKKVDLKAQKTDYGTIVENLENANTVISGHRKSLDGFDARIKDDPEWKELDRLNKEQRAEYDRLMKEADGLKAKAGKKDVGTELAALLDKVNALDLATFLVSRGITGILNRPKDPAQAQIDNAIARIDETLGRLPAIETATGEDRRRFDDGTKLPMAIVVSPEYADKHDYTGRMYTTALDAAKMESNAIYVESSRIKRELVELTVKVEAGEVKPEAALGFRSEYERQITALDTRQKANRAAIDRLEAVVRENRVTETPKGPARGGE